MTDEIIADNCYLLSPRTFLFAILVQDKHIAQDIAIIEKYEWHNMRLHFINSTGRPVVDFCYHYETIEDRLKAIPHVEIEGDNCIVNVKKIIENFQYTPDEKDLLDAYVRLQGENYQTKVYALAIRLKIDLRLFDDIGAAHLLRATFFYESPSDIEKRQKPKKIDFKPKDPESPNN